MNRHARRAAATGKVRPAPGGANALMKGYALDMFDLGREAATNCAEFLAARIKLQQAALELVASGTALDQLDQAIGPGVRDLLSADPGSAVAEMVQSLQRVRASFDRTVVTENEGAAAGPASRGLAADAAEHQR